MDPDGFSGSGSPGADPGGGGKGALPPPPFSGEKNKGAKNHTHRKKRSKSDNHEARYRLKRTPKHTKCTLKFSKKKSCEVGWGGRGPKGPQGEIFCS